MNVATHFQSMLSECPRCDILKWFQTPDRPWSRWSPTRPLHLQAMRLEKTNCSVIKSWAFLNSAGKVQENLKISKGIEDRVELHSKFCFGPGQMWRTGSRGGVLWIFTCSRFWPSNWCYVDDLTKNLCESCLCFFVYVQTVEPGWCSIILMPLPFWPNSEPIACAASPLLPDSHW